jgi:copper chaperone
MKTIIKIKGMSCGHCKASVEKAALGVPGVLAAQALLEKAELAVEYDEKKAALSDIRAAVESAGFKAG